ncbi:MAG: diguanylate cyclase [Bacillota bacterium]
MNKDNRPCYTTEYNTVLLNLNNFMLEQNKINDYEELIKVIAAQLDLLFNPVAIVYSEYDSVNQALSIKEINANQDVLNLVIKIGGRKFFYTVIPVNEYMYEKMTVDRIEIVSSLYEVTNEAVPISISNAIDKALNINCYLVLAFIVDGQLYGTTIIVLKKEPGHFIIELLRTYAHFTSISLKRVLAERTLREREQELKTITENITDLVSMADVKGRFTYISGNHYDLLGYEEDELLGRYIWEILYSEDMDKIANLFSKHISLGEDGQAEYRVVRKDGSLIWVDTVGSILNDDGAISGALFVTRDITDRKKAEEYIRYVSFHDQLTDLYNRHYFEQCKEELKEIPVLSVIMTDVNGLKLVNDTYGHKAGDELLKKYANILRKLFKQSDLFFRWGGDEFIIILKDTKEAKSWKLCNRLIKHCGEAFVNDIPLSISVGISSKLPGGDIDNAIQEAEDMMYKHKLTESKSSKNLIMKTLLETLSEKSFETKEHIDRISLIGRQFGERLCLPPSELSRLETLTMLHDIGKINIDKHILLKKTALTDEEWEEIIKHPEVGYRITRTSEEFAYVAEEILSHHERWDGKGYPQGLEGENTPYLARILNLIDSYEVMCNGRPYKKKMSVKEILEEIERCSGKQFDPDLAKEFVIFLREGYFGWEY